LDNLIDENQVTYFKKLNEYVFRASSDFEDEKEMFEMLDYYLTFFNDCEFLIRAIQKKRKTIPVSCLLYISMKKQDIQ
jgi:hypothetical protein